MFKDTWLDEHIETFVRPNLGFVPNDSLLQVDAYKSYYNIHPNFLKALKAFWWEAKRRARGKVILLPGRDTWEFEVLAKMEGFKDTIFRPDISSLTVRYIKEDYKDCYCIDSGYKGSIPHALGIEDFSLTSFTPSSYWYLIHPIKRPLLTTEVSKELKEKHQLFPYMVPYKSDPKTFNVVHKGSILQGMCSFLEGGSKYWTRAEMDPTDKKPKKGGKICQSIIEPRDPCFINAFFRTKRIAESCQQPKMKRVYF